MIGLGACGPRAAATFDPDQRPSPTILEVQNQTTADLNIYIVPESGARERLGTATSLVTTYFTIPQRHLLGVVSLRFQAASIGATRTLLSERIAVIPGDTVLLTIPPG
jgi:hypothetical protein